MYEIIERKKEILMLYFRISKYLLNILKEDIVRLLQVLYGSIESAFKTVSNHKVLNSVFGIIIKCGIDNVYTDLTSPSPVPCSINKLLTHTNHVQYLPLPPDILVSLLIIVFSICIYTLLTVPVVHQNIIS